MSGELVVDRQGPAARWLSSVSKSESETTLMAQKQTNKAVSRGARTASPAHAVKQSQAKPVANVAASKATTSKSSAAKPAPAKTAMLKSVASKSAGLKSTVSKASATTANKANAAKMIAARKTAAERIVAPKAALKAKPGTLKANAAKPAVSAKSAAKVGASKPAAARPVCAARPAAGKHAPASAIAPFTQAKTANVQRAVPASMSKPASQKISAPAPVPASIASSAHAASPHAATPKALAEKVAAARGAMAANKKPVAAEQRKPVAAEQRKPVAAEQRKPVAAEQRKPVAAERRKPVAAEQRKPVVADQRKPVVAEQRKPVVAEQRKPIAARHGFKTNEFVVYPAHGVGRIVGIEEQEIAGMSLELFVITFDKEKLTLRVPTGKLASVGMRKLAEEPIVKRAMETLKGRARVKRQMWSRRAQEYVAKINSGDLISIAEVVRDLYRSEAQPEQSYSERQLYEDALERMARELAAVERMDERGAVQRIVEILSKSAKGRRLAAEEAANTAIDTDVKAA